MTNIDVVLYLWEQGIKLVHSLLELNAPTLHAKQMNLKNQSIADYNA